MQVYDSKFRRINPTFDGGRYQPLLWDGTPWRAPKLTKQGKEFAPKDGAAGSSLEIFHKGQTVVAQVWADGPYAHSRWAVADGVAYLVSIKTGHIWETVDYRVRTEAA